MRCHSSVDLCVLGWPWATVVRPRCGRFSMQSTTINHAKSFIGSLLQTKTVSHRQILTELLSNTHRMQRIFLTN
jgi:hypothetical protein